MQLRVAIFITLAIIGQTVASAAEPSWGKPVNGVRLGLSVETVTPQADPILQVHFENTGTSDQTILLGGASGNGPTYNLWFQAEGANGHTCEVLNSTGGGVAGYIAPIVIRLAAAEKYQVELPMKKLVCVENRHDITLDTLLRQHFSVEASFKADRDGAVWARIDAPWLGWIHSAKLF